MENKHYIYKTISSLVKEDGTETSSNDKIVKEGRSLYAKLFKSLEDQIDNVDLETKLNIDIRNEEAIRIESRHVKDNDDDDDDDDNDDGDDDDSDGKEDGDDYSDVMMMA
ncbi:hypothetical protein PoB_007495700 [Plakobranchus ocellatus]|uniref:Uncharacterized protein n=1 Tax=Plakobranchus ocellatus TaxID=259542 RepID=A0AAV4DVY1_9GAST|nr:hypothetical protein PoB_007495700 [Plakobranchus ocellatus]